eukprot:ANDGO_07106.mRNA.1 Myb-related protein 3R-1
MHLMSARVPDLEITTSGPCAASPREMSRIGSSESVHADSPASSSSISASMKSRRKAVKWTTEEDKKLREAVELFGGRNWKRISEYVGTKDSYSTYQRWNRVIGGHVRREKFSIHELYHFSFLVKKYGSHAWSLVAEKLSMYGFPGRTDTQLRTRFLEIEKASNPLSEHLKRVIFELDEHQVCCLLDDLGYVFHRYPEESIAMQRSHGLLTLPANIHRKVQQLACSWPSVPSYCPPSNSSFMQASSQPSSVANMPFASQVALSANVHVASSVSGRGLAVNAAAASGAFSDAQSGGGAFFNPNWSVLSNAPQIMGLPMLPMPGLHFPVGCPPVQHHGHSTAAQVHHPVPLPHPHPHPHHHPHHSSPSHLSAQSAAAPAPADPPVLSQVPQNMPDLEGSQHRNLHRIRHHSYPNTGIYGSSNSGSIFPFSIPGEADARVGSLLSHSDHSGPGSSSTASDASIAAMILSKKHVPSARVDRVRSLSLKSANVSDVHMKEEETENAGADLSLSVLQFLDVGAGDSPVASSTSSRSRSASQGSQMSWTIEDVYSRISELEEEASSIHHHPLQSQPSDSSSSMDLDQDPRESRSVFESLGPTSPDVVSQFINFDGTSSHSHL